MLLSSIYNRTCNARNLVCIPSGAPIFNAANCSPNREYGALYRFAYQSVLACALLHLTTLVYCSTRTSVLWRHPPAFSLKQAGGGVPLATNGTIELEI